MGTRYPEVKDRGAEMIAIGNGTALMAQDFAEQFDVRFPLFTDPSRATYRVAGMRRQDFVRLEGIGATLKNGWRGFRAGFRQGRTQGDPIQNGGVLVLDRDGSVLYSHVESAAGDLADPEAVLAALSKARAA